MTARDWFTKAQNEGFAIGAFNVDNLDIFKAVCLAAQKKKSPVMLEFSQGEVDYFGLKNIVDLVSNAREEYKIPILLNLDHAKKVEDCLASIDQSFDDIHYDGSELPFAENAANAKKIVEAAHAKGILVEGEIDKIAGSSEVHIDQIDLETLKKSYTDPQKAAHFAAATGIDIYAAVFGNIHGTFPNQPDLDFNLLSEIKSALPATFLSMHGGSGIAAEQVKKAIAVGKIVKINVNTEIRQAFKDALGEELGENPNQSTYYKLTPDIILAVTAVVESKIDVFGSADRI